MLAHRTPNPTRGRASRCCTFGDLTDVTWWRELSLPTRTIIGRDGRVLREVPDWIVNTEAFDRIAGKTTFSAREGTVEMLRERGELVGEPKPTTRMTNFYERGDKPLEIVSTRQWYITNGGRDPELRAALLARGEELRWTPEHMRHRYANWVSGLNGDWLISRQRFFGVPFPVWYRLDADGEPDYDHPITADEASLPVDPASQPAPGFDESQRGVPGGFIGDPDVMDTWATSSLTPQIVCGWQRDDQLWNLTFPMDLAPQAHDIIRTWLFSRVVRSHLEEGRLPWRRAAISGFVVDPDRKKMSKSKGNVVVPTEILDRFGADAVRWRAAMARPGTDSPFDESQMKVGRRLAMKILNASKFVLDKHAPARPEAISEPDDLAMLAALRAVVARATSAFDEFQYTDALEAAEKFFWTFCDDYLELVKERSYGPDDDRGAASAKAALQLALGVQLRLFAPFMPFVTEEVWSWWQPGSVHRTAWPTVDELPTGGDAALLDDIAAVLMAIRGAKSRAQVKMRSEVDRAVVMGPQESLDRLQAISTDLRAVGRITGELEFVPNSEQISVDVTLAASGS